MKNYKPTNALPKPILPMEGLLQAKDWDDHGKPTPDDINSARIQIVENKVNGIIKYLGLAKSKNKPK